MEDYIFLIIAVVLSIFGALNQNRKKKAEEDVLSQTEARRSKSDPFLNFELMDVEDEEEEYERKQKEATRKAVLKKPLEPNKDTVFHAPKFKSTLPERKIKISLRPKEKPAQEEKINQSANENPSIMEDFSLRKAIIYSEIIKPNY